MKVNLFDIGADGNPKITKHVKNIHYLNKILKTYGEENSLKLFKIFDFVYNLNPQENPFANLPEENKFETVLRSTYPELIDIIDFEDEMIERALDLIEELYDTPKYRAFKVLKLTYEKILKELEFSNITLTKDEGNMAEINKATLALEDLGKKMNAAYKEYEEELDILTLKGGRESTDRRVDGKARELD